jgi:excisionase family DNA binding protein
MGIKTEKLLARTGPLAIAEVSDVLGFHEVTLRNWVRAGKVPAVRIGGQFDPAKLAGWVGARMTG